MFTHHATDSGEQDKINPFPRAVLLYPPPFPCRSAALFWANGDFTVELWHGAWYNVSVESLCALRKFAVIGATILY